jgi:hypothetical protein
MTRKKIFVAILNQGTISAGLETQLYVWMKDLAEKYIYSYFPTKYSYRPISNNRNRIVKDFLASDCEYLFMLDDDNPPLKNPLKLLEYDKDVIGAIYPGRDNNGIHFHIYKFGKDYPKKISFDQYDNDEIKGLTKIDAIGTGCIIIRRNVLEKIKRPFEDRFDEDGTLVTNDDLYFSHKCRENGFEVWTHGDYMCSHYKTVDLLQMAHLLIKAKNVGRETDKTRKVKNAGTK